VTISLRRSFRSVLARSYRFLLPPSELPLIDQIIRRQFDRFTMYERAADFVNYEAVEGDILEFGVFGGVSLALLAKVQSFDPKGMTRKIAGFDSFQGLPPSEEPHARWRTGDCARVHAWHPTLDKGKAVNAEVTRDLFERCGLPQPELEIGPFQETLARTVSLKYRAVAILHIDCDLYESTKVVLESVAPILQEGTVLLFDEWFSYKGNPGRGEARAYLEFLKSHREWGSQPYQTYGAFSNSFILYRR
jgi:hypothetical protein